VSGGKNRQNVLVPILMPLGILAAIVLVLFGFSRMLLSASHMSATVLALVTASSILGVATFVSLRPQVTRSLIMAMIGGVAGVALIVGGVAVAVGPDKPVKEVAAQAAKISAPSGAAVTGFDTKALSWAPGKPVNLTFANQDSTGHNFYIAASQQSVATPLFSGITVDGGTSYTYQVKPLAAGTYFFFCNIHPTTMTGTLTVAAGGAGVNISAHNLAFSATTFQLAAGQPSTINFDNQDSGTSHNIGIYQDAAYTNEVFKGALVVGPSTFTYQVPALAAGTYYFKCDIHPTMNGTVTVSGGSAPGPSGSASAPGSASGSASASASASP
jgi:plastocyanin